MDNDKNKTSVFQKVLILKKGGFPSTAIIVAAHEEGSRDFTVMIDHDPPIEPYNKPCKFRLQSGDDVKMRAWLAVKHILPRKGYKILLENEWEDSN